MNKKKEIMNRKSRRIVHIIPDQKFTLGYMNYMTKEVSQEIEHFFVIITKKKENKFELPDLKKTKYICINKPEQLFQKSVFTILKDSDKIIVSGVFNGVWVELVKMPRKIMKKIYLHFWGGDFYGYRDVKILSKDFIYKMLLWRCIRRCAGIITLVPRDYDELSKIFPNSKPHFTAAMPEDPDRVDNYGKYFSKRVKSNKILLGNSATRENCHFEVMELLEHLKDENLEIICPLAYGDRSYAMSVEEEGMRIFGSKFKAILDYQDFDSYKNMIAGCSVGIFANNRQQAMGNIAMMIMMGRKVYLREGTSMWYSYLDYGIKMYPISELNKITYSELMDYNESIAMENDKKIRKRYNDYVRNWSAIFNI